MATRSKRDRTAERAAADIKTLRRELTRTSYRVIKGLDRLRGAVERTTRPIGGLAKAITDDQRILHDLVESGATRVDKEIRQLRYRPDAITDWLNFLTNFLRRRARPLLDEALDEYHAGGKSKTRGR